MILILFYGDVSYKYIHLYLYNKDSFDKYQ